MSLFGSLAGLGGTALGAFVGSLIFPGIGTAIGALIGGSLGSLAGNYLFPEKYDLNLPPPPQPQENRVQISTYGESIPIVYGSSRLAGNIIYMQDVVEDVDRSRHRQDGVRYYEMVKTYTSTFAVAFCEGPVVGISRIWVNNKLFADFRNPTSANFPIGSTGLVFANLDTTIARSEVYFQVYLGTEDQTADPTLAELLGEANTPAYKGICYIVFKDFPVGEYSGIPTIEVEIGEAVEPVDFTEWASSNATVTEDEVLFDRTYTGDLTHAYATPGLAAEYNSFELVWEWEITEVTGTFYPDVSYNYAYVQLANNSYAPINGINVRFGTNGAGNYRFALWMYAGAANEYDNGLNIYTSLPVRRTLRLSRVGTTCTLYIYNGSSLEETLSVSNTDFTHTDLSNFQFGLMIQGGAVGTHMRMYLRDVQFSDQSVSGATGEVLSDIVTDICTRSGLSSTSIDVSELTDEVVGYKIPRQMQARTCIEPLMAAYSFDATEIDWQLVFKKRGSTSVATIQSNEMRAYVYGENIPDRAIETRTQDLELPTHLTLSYESKVRDYQTASQNAVRVDKENFLPRETGLGIVMTDSKAKQQAEIILKQLWTNRHRYAFSTTYKYLKLSPGDVITVNGKLMRVVEMADRNGVVDFVCESEQGGTYLSDAEADDLTIEPIDLTASTYIPSFFTMDMPTYDADVGNYGLWFAIYGSSAFSGGSIERSNDGAVFEAAGYYGSVSAVVGKCQQALSSGISGIIDNSTTIGIDLSTSAGTLASVGTSNLWENGNLAAVGCATAGWEILQFQTATTTTSVNVYNITGFLRGLYGTENYRGIHSTNDYFVLLTSTAGAARSGVEFIGAPAANLGSAYYYRVKNSDDVTGTPALHTVGKRTLDPYAPQIAFGSRNSSNDIDLNWYRGDRYEFEQDDMPESTDVAMNEVSLNFSVDVIHPVSSAVLRTVQTTASTWAYTAAMQSSDSYPQTHPILFDIYQWSTVTSTRGQALRVSI